MPCRLINGFRRLDGACCLHLQGSLRRLCCVEETVYYMRKERQSPPKWRLTMYQLIWHYNSHDMNLHQERCENHKSRYILSRFLKLSFGQVYSSNTLLVTESYNEETLTWDVTENVSTAVHIVILSSYDWRTTKWEKAFRILLQASQCERQQKLSPKSLASVLWKHT